MKKLSFSYVFIDPSSAGYSASRVASIFMVVVDTLWVLMAILGVPPKEAYAPVSSMLSAVSVATFGAYGVNSFARAWSQTNFETSQQKPPAKPASPEV